MPKAKSPTTNITRTNLRKTGYRFFCFRLSAFGSGLPYSNGFTLIEILVSIAVIVILAAIMWQGLSAFKESHDLNQSVEQALGFLKEARVKTLASEEARQYGVHFEEDRFILFYGASYDPLFAVNSFNMPPLVRISVINLAGGGSDVVFERLTGKTAQPGTITFESRRALMQKNIEILDSGLANTQ